MAYVRVTPLNRAVQVFWNREQSQAEKDAEARYIAAQQALRDEFRQQWTLPEPSPDDPDCFEKWGVEGAAFECWLLRRQGLVAAATTPYWVNQVEEMWLTSRIMTDSDGIFEREQTAASITLPFLMPGGEFSITYESRKQRDSDKQEIETRIHREKRLRVQSEHGIHYGHLRQHTGEMSYDIVALPAGTPQDIADRVAEAYGRIIQLDMPKDYPVVMPLQEHCTFCGRPFTDQVSKVIGIGPVCAPRLGVPHSAEYANHIVAARRAYLDD